VSLRKQTVFVTNLPLAITCNAPHANAAGFEAQDLPAESLAKLQFWERLRA